MKFKRLTAALASGMLLWGSAYAEQKQPENTAPDATGATGPGVVILELGGAPGTPGAQEASPEEQLAMQLLLLQLLMMQADPSARGEAPMSAPTSSGGTGI